MTIPAAALERHIGILGKTGSGKSNTAKTIAERIMLAGGRVAIIDPTGTWWGIRLRPDGLKKSKFEPVIFGGNHADIPISGEHGALIAEAIATASSSAIIDCRLMTVGQRTKFFTAFAEVLLRHNRGPLTLIIDEAHLFAPQGRVNDPQSGAMVGAANNLVSLGRGIGLRIILISQRPAKLHKDSLTQVETLVAMRLIAPQDRRAIEDWIGEWADPGKGKEITASLPSLPTGNAWVWSPEIDILEKVRFPLAATFDSGKAPSIGDAGPTLTPIDVKAIGEKMDAIRQEATANDPVRLKRQIADLQKQVADASKQAAKINSPDPAAIEAAEARGYERGREDGLQFGTTRGAALALSAIRNAMDALRIPDIVLEVATKAVGDPASSNGRTSAFDAVNRGSNPRAGTIAAPKPASASVSKTPETPVQRDGDRKPLTNPQAALLGTLAWWRAMGHEEPTRAQIAAKVGWKVGGSNLRNRFADLSGMGLLEYPQSGRVRLTAAGIDTAPEPDTAETLIESIRRELTNPQRALFDVLVEAARQLTRDELGTALGWEPGGSNMRNRLADLSARELVRYPAKGVVELQDWVR